MENKDIDNKKLLDEIDALDNYDSNSKKNSLRNNRIKIIGSCIVILIVLIVAFFYSQNKFNLLEKIEEDISNDEDVTENYQEPEEGNINNI